MPVIPPLIAFLSTVILKNMNLQGKDQIRNNTAKITDINSGIWRLLVCNKIFTVYPVTLK